MVASFSSETRNRDNLIAGGATLVSRSVTLLSGENRSRGALLGRVKRANGGSTADAGNTGDGTMTNLGMKAETKVGTYRVECVEAIVDGGRFEVVDPDGERLDDAVVGTPYDNGHLTFDLNDGAADFAVGDKFTIAINAGSGKYQLSDDTAVDGSEDPEAVLAADTDASAGDKAAAVYVAGEFNENQVTFGGSHTADSVREILAERGIHLKPAEAA